MATNSSFELTINRLLIFGTMVSNSDFKIAERTKKNFSYDGGVARPQLESVGGTDYIKPREQ